MTNEDYREALESIKKGLNIQLDADNLHYITVKKRLSLKTDETRFNSYWKRIFDTFDNVKRSNDAELMLNHLESLYTFLELKVSEPKIINNSHIDKNKNRHLAYYVRSTWIDEWIKDKIFPVIKSVIDKLKAIKSIKKANRTEKPPPPKTLFDIWLPDRKGNKNEYNNQMEKLKDNYISTNAGVWYWNKSPKKGWAQSLAAFIHTCIDRGWIANDHSSAEYVRLIKGTFNVEPNGKPFKSIASTPPKDQYLKPFKNMPRNV